MTKGYCNGYVLLALLIIHLVWMASFPFLWHTLPLIHVASDFKRELKSTSGSGTGECLDWLGVSGVADGIWACPIRMDFRTLALKAGEQISFLCPHWTRIKTHTATAAVGRYITTTREASLKMKINFTLQ